LRGAAILKMLAQRHEVFLLIANYQAQVPGPRDDEIEKLCREIRHLPAGAKVSATELEKDRLGPRPDVGFVPIQPLTELEGAAAVWKFYEEHQMDLLFVFTLASIGPVESCFRQFPRRYLDVDELPSARENRIAGLKPSLSGPEAALAQTKMKAWRLLERVVIPAFHQVFVCSPLEAAQVRERCGGMEARLLPNISPVRPHLSGRAQGQPREILFVGSLSYFPNEDGALYFAREIFPLIRREKGDTVIFRIVGFQCPARIRQWDGRDGVQVTGYAEDLTPFYERASIVVVPLRAGGGTRLKILEAFTYGRPVVSTAIGAEGLQITSGENLLVADSPEAFATACLELLDRPERAEALVQGGLKVVQEFYSAEALGRYYDQAVRERSSETESNRHDLPA
jgi:glycosyltransferase involved in cell wall biosynthesis